MDMNRLTQKSQEALHDAQTKALRFGHTEVDGEHLLLALLDQPEGLVPRLLARRAPTRTGCARTWRRSLSRRPAGTGPGAAPGQVFVTQRLSRLLDDGRAGGQAAQGRVRLRGAPGASPCSTRDAVARPAGCCSSTA